jgi:hypothetical protein
MGDERWSAQVDAAEIRRRAEAAADVTRYEAQMYVTERRREAEAVMDRARAHLLAAESRAIAIEAQARDLAAAIVRQAEADARRIADEILAARAVGGGDVVIDLRGDMSVDQIDARLESAVQTAVRRALNPPAVHAGRYHD